MLSMTSWEVGLNRSEVVREWKLTQMRLRMLCGHKCTYSFWQDRCVCGVYNDLCTNRRLRQYVHM